MQQDRKRRCLVFRLLAVAEDFSDHILDIIAAYLSYLMIWSAVWSQPSWIASQNVIKYSFISQSWGCIPDTKLTLMITVSSKIFRATLVCYMRLDLKCCSCYFAQVSEWAGLMLRQVLKYRSGLSRIPGEDAHSARECQEEKVPIEPKDCGHGMC